MDSWLNKFKDYVPAEILAAFITINSLVPYRADMDLGILILAVFVLTIFFVVASLAAKKPPIVVTIVALTLPLWCLLVAVERLDNYYSSDDLRIVVSVLLVLVSVGLTLFVPKAPPSAGHQQP